MRVDIRFTASALALVATIMSIPAAAQTWPQRAVRLILPLPPGTGADIAGRLLAERLSQRWGHPVVVENRQGGDGIPAVQTLLGARDDHTLLMSFAGIITINPFVHERLPYNPTSDLVPIVPVVDTFLGVAASSALKADKLADLIKIAKSQPGKLNWAATPGLPHYAWLALMQHAAIDMTQVSYRAFAPAIQDMTQGRLHVAATGMPLLVPHHHAGTAKLMFVTNTTRSPLAPEVPTAREAGYPEITLDGIIGIYGGRDMSDDIRTRLSDDVRAVANDENFRAKVAASGSMARSGSPAEFTAAIKDQHSKIAAIHKAKASQKR